MLVFNVFSFCVELELKNIAFEKHTIKKIEFVFHMRSHGYRFVNKIFLFYQL